MEFLSRFEETLRCQKFITEGDKVFVACSGGPDSTALFHLLESLREKWRLRLGLLHFNHRLRGTESERDERFVKKLARSFGVPVYVGRRRIPKGNRRVSVEEGARQERYDFLVRAARRHRLPKIAFGHTLDDQAETVLMRVLQGTGLRGLLGIRPRIQIDRLMLARPLLSFSKKEIVAFLKERHISFCRDRSNASTRFVRNRLRIKVMPWLAREFNPRLAETLARIPAIVREESALMDELERAAWKRAFRARRRAKLYLDRPAFLKFPSPLQFRILVRALQTLDPQSGLGFDAWQKLRANLGRKRFSASLPRDITLSLTSLKLTLYKRGVKP